MSKKQTKEQQSPSNIEADEISQLAIKYRHTDNRVEKNKLFKEISKKYMPKIKGILRDTPRYDHSEVLQIYYVEILVALDKWNMKCNFATYMYNYIISVLRKYMKNKKILRQGIECSSLDALEYDVLDSEDDIWDKVYNEGSTYYDKPKK